MNVETKKFLIKIDYLEKKLIGEDKKIFVEVLHLFNECARMLEEKELQVKKQKEVTDKLKRYINGCLEVSPIEDRSVTDDVLDKEFKYLLKILNEVSE